MPISTIDQTGLNAPLTLTSPTLSSPVTSGTPTGVGVLTSGTAQASTSGTSITFSSIPSWVKRITIMMNGVSLSGSSSILVQIGSGSTTTSGYNSAGGYVTLAGGGGGIASTAGFLIFANNAAYANSGSMTLTNISGTTWVGAGSFSYQPQYAGTNSGVSPALSGALDRVVITTVNGTDTFDAGTINILYE